MKEAAVQIGELVRRFRDSEDLFSSVQSGYNEESTRNEFIGPFFEAFGWDVTNKTGAAEQYKDCVHEEGIKVGGQTKAPDYSFRFGGQRKFFVEAKKPAVSIADDRAASYQLRRYAWSAKLPVSVLTNFAELAVYDTRIRPREGEKAAVGRIDYFTFSEYAERLDELWQMLAKDAVHRGSFDRFAQDVKRHRGTQEVDDAFLADIERWREMLAKNIAVRNMWIGIDELNYVVQATIDRIIFLRIAEDRSVEPYGQLRRVLQRPNVYKQLATVFRMADAKYNSGLFDFGADAISLALEIDDKILQAIVDGLYYPNSPYEFAVIPVEILGQVYERFLGKIIRLTPAHHAKIDEKPEVKKSGGVYYTPEYIVDEIVAKTVRPVIKGRSPSELASFQIVDPACGSGSFLIGAYAVLMRHYLEWYENHNPTRRAKEVFRVNGTWHLTTREKKRILLQHIFGVDIDSQAVEVTKLSLLLKVMEGENRETVEQTAKLFAERALPNLDENIKCGNSLISSRDLGSLILNDSDKKRVNAFDWELEFADVMRHGGFSVVIGNPPYVRIQTMKEWAPLEVELYKELYASARAGSYDIYTAFVERGLSLLRREGQLGYILPHKFFNSKYGESLRKLIASGSHLNEVVHFGDIQIFRGATTYTCLLFLQKQPAKIFTFSRVHDLTIWRSTRGGMESGKLSSNDVTGADWDFVAGVDATLYRKVRAQGRLLDEIAEIFVGVQTSADDVFILDRIGEKDGLVRARSSILGRDVELETGVVCHVVSGTDVKAFATLPSRQVILYPYDVDAATESARLISMKEMTRRYPRAARYLTDNKLRLESRESGKFRDSEWHRFGRTQNLGIQQRRKVCVPRLVDPLAATLDDAGAFVLDNVDVGGVTLRPAFAGIRLEYICALLNSDLLRWYFPFVSAPFRGGYRSANRQFLGKLPIYVTDLEDARQVRLHSSIIELERRMRTAVARRALTPHQRDANARDVAELARQLNELIYAAYGLTEGEVAVVNGGRRSTEAFPAHG
ncbi:MAG: Eco57I restriction-modification methylase domain-containing protein [Thermoanaerobaculia bacterium]